MRSKRCERCPDEDTLICEECDYHGVPDAPEEGAESNAIVDE